MISTMHPGLGCSAKNEMHKQLKRMHCYFGMFMHTLLCLWWDTLFHGPHRHPRCCRQGVFRLSFDGKTLAGLSNGGGIMVNVSRWQPYLFLAISMMVVSPTALVPHQTILTIDQPCSSNGSKSKCVRHCQCISFTVESKSSSSSPYCEWYV